MTADTHASTGRGTATAVVLASFSVAVAIFICSAIVTIAEPNGFWRTLAFVWIAAIAGTLMIFRTAARVNDERVLNLVHVWALKLIVGLAVLYFGWVPGLDQTSPDYGYDPQRFYFQAEVLQQSGYQPAAAAVMNYTAVLYVYAFVFGAVGHNSFGPALVNAIIALWCILAVLRFMLAMPRSRPQRYWLVGLTLVIPEIIWFDNLVSRETLSTALLTVGILGCTSYLLPRDAVRRLRVVSFGAAIPSLAFLGVLRMSALAAAMAAIAAIYFAHRMTMKQRLIAIVALAVMVGAMAVAPSIIRRLGGYEITYLKELDPTRRAKNVTKETAYEWSEGSIGRRLVGDTPAKLILLSPVRMVIYLILPLPNAGVSLSEMAAGRWLPWQTALTALSAGIYILLVPSILALGIDVMRKRAPPGASIIFIAFAVILTAIVVGNQILHERYRVMSIPLLIACAVLGRNASRSSRRVGIAIWVFTLGSAVAAYLVIRGIA